MQAIDAYLKAPPPGYALLIEGPWGAGKTYFWRRKSQELDGLGALTFSVAGLNSYADLERALFQASIATIGPKAAIEAGTVLGRAFLRFVNVNPEDITLKAEAASGKTVVCIDDLERFAGDFSVLFGFVVNLLDDNRVHCILIADEKRAMELEGYGVSKERIVGKTVRLVPNLRGFCDDVINGFANDQSRTTLQNGADKIADIIQSSGVLNLRTVRFFLAELEEIVRNLSEEEASVVMDSALPGALAFAVFAVSRQAENAALVVRAFMQGDLGMSLAMHDASKGDEQEDDTEIGKLAKLLAELRLDGESYGWPKSPALVAMFEGGNFSYTQLATDFGLHAMSAVEGQSDPLATLKEFYNHDDETVRSAIHEARELLFSLPAHISQVWEIFETLYFFATRGIFEPTPDAWTAEVLCFVQELDANPDRISSSVFEPWIDEVDMSRSRVLAACRSAVESHGRLLAKKQQQAALDALVSGSGKIPDATDFEIFADAVDPGEVLRRIRDVGMPAVVRFRRFFSSRLRIQNAADFVGGDRDMSLELADRIVTEVRETRPMLLADAELLAFARTLRDFATSVDRWREVNNRK